MFRLHSLVFFFALLALCRSAEQWSWIAAGPSSGVNLTCRDGSSTGLGVRPGTTADTALVIYLQGGGACYDAASCAGNANAPVAGARWSRQDFEGWRDAFGDQGIFNTNDPSNPVAGWTHVYVPYCSGDLHGGLKTNAAVPGVAEPQTFLGFQNIASVIAYLKPLYPNVVDVALVGASAGGFGVLINYEQVAEAFGSVVGIVDAAPIIPEFAGIRTACFQDTLMETFNLQLPAGCPECADTSQGGLINLYSYLPNTFPRPQGRFGLMSEDGDQVGATLYDVESKKCGGVGVNFISYRSALIKLRDEYIGNDWATFLLPGLIHTMTQSDELFLNRKLQGSSAAQWVGRISESPPVHIPEANLESPNPTWCFSAKNLVEVQGKGLVTMDQLRIGHYVRTSQNEYSLVYSFGHYDTTAQAPFLQIHALDMDRPLEVSREHMVYILDDSTPMLVPAGHVNVGDELWTTDGKATKVVEIGRTRTVGVFAPYTVTGDISVNGVVASTYVAILNQQNMPAGWPVQHFMQHSLNAPHRIWCYMSLDSCRQEAYSAGISLWVVPHRAMADCFARRHSVIQFAFLYLVAIPGHMMLMISEKLILSRFFVRMCLLCATIWLMWIRRCSWIRQPGCR